MGSERYPEEFKIEAVRQVVERGHSVAELAIRLGMTTHSLYSWKLKYGPRSDEQQAKTSDEMEIKQLKKEPRRVWLPQDPYRPQRRRRALQRESCLPVTLSFFFLDLRPDWSLPPFKERRSEHWYGFNYFRYLSRNPIMRFKESAASAESPSL